MRPFHEPDTSRQFIPADIKARVMPAVLDELARWGVERFSIEALAERHRLDAAMIYRYWGDRQRLIMDAALDDAEAIREALDTGSLRGDLLALARHIAAQINTMHGRIFLRALVMDGRGHHDTDTRLNYWRERFAVVRTVIDRARQRGELRDGINTLAAVQIVSSPLYIRGLYGDGPVDDGYCEIIADMAWHALARR